ncbi:MAG: response regulator [Bacillota bacterium]
MNKYTTNNKAIICVDDERIVLNSLKSELSGYMDSGYAIEIAESGPEAIELVDDLLSNGYDIPVIISDYIMPGMKGDILLKEVHHKSPETFKILLTGQAVIEGITNAVNNAELYKYFDKPWNRTELNKAVADAIELYYVRRHQNEELMSLIQHEKHLIKEIEYIEAKLTIHENYSGENLEKMRSNLLALKKIYRLVLDLKTLVDSSKYPDTNKTAVDDMVLAVKELEKALESLDRCSI